MKKLTTLIVAIIVCAGVTAAAQKPFDFMVEGSFTKGIEGPATDAQGYVYAVNFAREGTIGRVDPETGVGRVWVDLRTAVNDSSTANGLHFAGDGKLYVADYGGHNLLAIDTATRAVSVVAHNPEMSQPNDLAISPTGTIYLSDPDWKSGRGKVWIYRKGRLSLLLQGLSCTNGIEVSPLGERLYVGLSNERKIMVYDIAPDGSLVGGREFITFPDAGLDGMRCDIRGNLYVTRYDAGQVVVLTPEGKVRSTIQLRGRKPSNLTFSDNMVFVTMADRGCFEVFQADFPGRAVPNAPLRIKN